MFSLKYKMSKVELELGVFDAAGYSYFVYKVPYSRLLVVVIKQDHQMMPKLYDFPKEIP